MGFSRRVSKGLIDGRPYFEMWNPALNSLFVGQLATALRTIKFGKRTYDAVKAGADIPEAMGEAAAAIAFKQIILRKPRGHIHGLYQDVQQEPAKDLFRKNGLGGRGWIHSPGEYPMTIVFHDANRVGPHIDVHIGRVSLVYRIKPELYEQLRYNRQGMLTEVSRQAILDHIRSEVGTGSRVPQNLDHSRSNAGASWTGGDPAAVHYGAGRTRQVVHASTAYVYKAHDASRWDKRGAAPVEFYAPVVNPHRPLYLYKLHPGSDRRAPILIWGAKRSAPPSLDERLHLKLIQPDDLESVKHQERVDEAATTAKYDGSSAYLVITPKGTTVWSPRQSKRTGEQIEYTHKLGGLAHVTSPETIVAMGEVVFRRREGFRGRHLGPYLPQGTGSGFLNSNDVIPKDIVPEIRLYRVDRIGRTRTLDLSFWENRALQEQVAKLSPRLAVVKLMSPSEAVRNGFEGVVTIPKGGNVVEGFKTKWWGDANDWRVDEIAFREGDRGGVAGVLWATSLESGRRYKLGPSQVGDRTLTRAMMQNPRTFEGTVLKVRSRHGHEGRAAKVLGIHDDKGTAPLVQAS